LVIAVIVSIAVHASAFWGIGRPGKKAAVTARDDTPTIALTMPDAKDLEEPDPTPSDSAEPVEASSYVPSLADLPQTPRPDDFVQKIDLNSLVEHPDMSTAKVFSVPDNVNRGAALRNSMGAIFNLADLDRVPEALVQPPPLFPKQYKNEVPQATVVVQFIVTTNGEVVNPVVMQSTHSGFNTPAMMGVSKWKFRPGQKAGRKVNTRMEVPIIFSVSSE
jgi:protein TonB